MLIWLLARIGRIAQLVEFARDLRYFIAHLGGRQGVIRGVLYLGFNICRNRGSSFDDDNLVRNGPSPNGRWLRYPRPRP